MEQKASFTNNTASDFQSYSTVEHYLQSVPNIPTAYSFSYLQPSTTAEIHPIDETSKHPEGTSATCTYSGCSNGMYRLYLLLTNSRFLNRGNYNPSAVWDDLTKCVYSSFETSLNFKLTWCFWNIPVHSLENWIIWVQSDAMWIKATTTTCFLSFVIVIATCLREEHCHKNLIYHCLLSLRPACTVLKRENIHVTSYGLYFHHYAVCGWEATFKRK